MIDIKSIEKIIGYTFQNKSLLIQAFTHPSYAHMTGMLDNDRMEYLGDAILDDVVSIYIYNAYPQLDAGDLTKLRATIVSAQGLKPIVKEMGLLKHLLVADGADVIKRLGKKIEADLFEAVLGAIYLDVDMKVGPVVMDCEGILEIISEKALAELLTDLVSDILRALTRLKRDNDMISLPPAFLAVKPLGFHHPVKTLFGI